MIAIVSSGFVFMIFAHIKFTANNRFDFLVVLYLCIVPINRFDKMKSAHQVAVIGNGNGLHIIICSSIDQLIDARGRLQDRKLRVIM